MANGMLEGETRQARGVAQLMTQLARRVLERRTADDLHAAQWSALRYFDRAGRQVSTIAGLSRYLGNTTGSASRTVRSLCDRGYLIGTPSREDGRSVLFSLTPSGREVLTRDPLLDLARALSYLDADDLRRLTHLLDRVQRRLDLPSDD